MTGAGLLGAAGGQGAAPPQRAFLHTALCDRLGIPFPVLQSGMGRVAGPELVAAVSEAGGLGILAGLGVPPDELRRQIHRVRELTDRPFGVNLWLHAELRPPVHPDAVPEDRLREVRGVLNAFRARLGIPARTEELSPFPDTIDAAFEVILEERVRVFSTGLGNPGAERVARCRERDILVMSMVATVEEALEVAAAGVDVVVAQGGEAGGHRSTGSRIPSKERANIGTMTLVPQIVDAVSVPVVAAGGIADGRGLVAALALGASGALLGTRFVATRESMAPAVWKQAIRDGGSDTTTVTTAFTGLHARVLGNRFSREYEESGAPVLPSLLQALEAQDIFTAAARSNDREYFPLMSGQCAGMIDDEPGAGEVVASIVGEADEVLRSLPGRLADEGGRS